ncbi:carbohydrate kinase [Rhodococcus aerolatus]
MPTTRSRVVVCGEALVDLVPSGDLLDPRLGGGPLNVAVALGRLGATTSFCSRVSTDAFGERVLARLAESEVDTALVARGPEPTTLAVVALGPDGSAGYSFYVDGTADRLLTEVPALPDDTAVASFGTLSLVLEPGASAYAAALHRAHDAGVTTVLDPNVRAQLVPDADAYRARYRSWLPAVDVLKVSDDDLAWLGGTPTDALAAGVGAVVLTRGGDGLVVHTAAGEVGVPAPPVTVADTIGAGDTVHAVLCEQLAARGVRRRADLLAWDEPTWTAVLERAARAAAVTVARPGADVPWAHELG